MDKTINELIDDLEDAYQSDLENGVKWLNEAAALEFATRFPKILEASMALIKYGQDQST